MAFTLPQSVMKKIDSELNIYRKTNAIKDMTVPDFFLHLEKKRFALYDEMLAKDESFPRLLNDIPIVDYIVSAIAYYDQRRYNLMAYCIMPNHVHLLLIPLDDEMGEKYSQALIMKSIKGYSAYKINQVLKKQGAFWQREYYDHIIRNDIELARCLNYIANNPVKAGLVTHWKEWKHTLIKAEYQQYLPSE